MRAPLLLSILILVGAHRAIGAPAPPAPQPPPGQSASPEAVPAYESFAAGLAEARRKGDARLFVFLDEKGNGECDRMKSLILPARQFREYVDGKVVVFVDIRSKEGAQLAERFRIASAPAWLVMTPDGVLSWRQSGPTSQDKWFESLLRSEQSWTHYQGLLAEEAKKPNDAALVFENAKETFRRQGDARAEAAFRRLLAEPTTPADVREQCLAYLATIEMDSRRLDDARSHLETLLKTSKDPVLRERSLLRLAEVEIGRRNYAGATARLEEFARTYPNSGSKADAEELRRLVATLSPDEAGGQKK